MMGSNESISSMDHDPPANKVSDVPPLPNYMKPTISSQMMKNTKKPKCREAKPFLKKSKLPDINPRKTCSSILKESKFPKQLKLRTGERIKWEDTSAQHVCRYTHCSLNGNDLSPQPTAQKSFSFLKCKKAKCFSSKEFYLFEKSRSCLEEQKINREIIVHTKKPSDDYFVEIYANRNGKIEMHFVNTKSISSIDQSTEYSDELELSVENAKSEKEVPRCRENGFTSDLGEINNREDIEETRRDPATRIVKDIVDKHVKQEDLMIDFNVNGDSKHPDEALKFSGDKWSSEKAHIPTNISEENPNTFIDPSNISSEVGIIEKNETVKNKDGSFKTFMSRILPTDIINPNSISCGLREKDEAAKNNENELAERKSHHFEYETTRNVTVRNDEMENETEDPKNLEKVKTLDMEISEEYDSKVILKSQTISFYDEEQGENKTMLQSELCHEGAQCSNLSNGMVVMNPVNDQVTRELRFIPHEGTIDIDSKSILYDCKGKLKSGSSSLYDDDGVEFEELLHDICNLYSNVSEQRGENIEESSNGHHGPPDILQKNGIQLDMEEEYLTTVFKHLTGIVSKSDQSLPDTIRKIKEAASMRKIGSNEGMHKLNRKAPNLLPRKYDPEAEKLELRHQEMDERKKADTWMLDCALRQIIANLSTCREKKVSLLVEAFESVLPVPLPL